MSTKTIISNNFDASKFKMVVDLFGSKCGNKIEFVENFNDSFVSSDKMNAKIVSGEMPLMVYGTKQLYGNEAICMNLSHCKFFGSMDSVFESIIFITNYVKPHIENLNNMLTGIQVYNKKVESDSKTELLTALDILNSRFLAFSYMSCEHLTLSDASLLVYMGIAYSKFLEPSIREKLPFLNRWFETVRNTANYEKYFGKFEYCTKWSKPDFSKLQKTKKAKEEVKPKKDKPVVVEKPIVKPFANEPMPKMDLENFKRFFFNTKDKQSVVAQFLNEFDSTTQSVWTCEYLEADKYLGLGFTISNMVEGMFQRLLKLKNHGMGIMVISTKPKKAVTGLWFWRGQGLAFEQDINWMVDYITYDWKKIDATSDQGKQYVTNFFSVVEGGTINGNEAEYV
ncbi:EF-1-gamma, partial [Intoshia linei]